MRKPESDVEKAALKWWKEKRPLAWNAAKHRRNPDINTSNGYYSERVDFVKTEHAD